MAILSQCYKTANKALVWDGLLRCAAPQLKRYAVNN